MAHSVVVSVIVPVFNQQKYVGRALRSLLDQGMPASEYEIIVINDGSTDNTAKVLASFPPDPRLRIIHFKKNQGLPAAVNRGCEMALGRFIVRVDADDYVSDQFLSILSLFLSQNDDMDSVGCDYFKVDDNESVIGRFSSVHDPIACGIMFRKENLFDIGLYDESFKMHEDLELRERYLKKFSIYNIKLPLYRYRMHDSNMTKNKRKDRYFRSKLAKKTAGKTKARKK